MREKVSDPITNARLNEPVFNRPSTVASAKSGADRLEIEGGAEMDAEPGRHAHRRCRKGVVRRGGADDDQVDRLGVDAGMVEGRAGCMDRKVGRELALCRRIPVRCTIQSSDVSTVLARSALLSALAGR
jgi:hypothetical protein